VENIHGICSKGMTYPNEIAASEIDGHRSEETMDGLSISLARNWEMVEDEKIRNRWLYRQSLAN